MLGKIFLKNINIVGKGKWNLTSNYKESQVWGFYLSYEFETPP